MHLCDMTRSYVRCYPFICVVCLVHVCDVTSAYVWYDSFIRETTWLVYTCDMTRLHMWHDSFTHVTWLVYTCDMTRLHMWHDLPRTRYSIPLVYCHKRQIKLRHYFIYIHEYSYVCMYMCIVHMLCVPWLTYSATGLAHIILLFGQPPSVVACLFPQKSH